MRLHAIYAGKGNTLCPRCARPALEFRRENRLGDLYRCLGCGFDSLHLEGEHFHGVWSRVKGVERVALCPFVYRKMARTFEGGIVGAARQLVSVMRTPRPCDAHGRRGKVYGVPRCADCRQQLLKDLGAAVEQGLANRFAEEDWSMMAVAEVRRMFGRAQ